MYMSIQLFMCILINDIVITFVVLVMGKENNHNLHTAFLLAEYNYVTYSPSCFSSENPYMFGIDTGMSR